MGSEEGWWDEVLLILLAPLQGHPRQPQSQEVGGGRSMGLGHGLPHGFFALSLEANSAMGSTWVPFTARFLGKGAPGSRRDETARIIFKKNKVVEFTPLDCKSYYKATGINTGWYRGRVDTQINRTENPEVLSPKYGQLYFDKGEMAIECRRTVFAKNWCWKIRLPKDTHYIQTSYTL